MEEIFDASLIRKVFKLKDKISPEREYIFGALFAFVYLKIYADAKSFPPEIQTMLTLMKEAPGSETALFMSTAVCLMISADGARRIVKERFPFYKAYLQVFLLHTDV